MGIDLHLHSEFTNSFKHGFGIDYKIPSTYAPEIELLIVKHEKRGLRIEVKDNESGFQADTMDQLLRVDEKENTTNQSIPSNLGINNVFQRLQLHYGSENIHMFFESTPFYRTSILIQIDNFMDKQQSL